MDRAYASILSGVRLERKGRSAGSWYVRVFGEKNRFETALFGCFRQLIGTNRIIGREDRNAVFHSLPRTSSVMGAQGDRVLYLSRFYQICDLIVIAGPDFPATGIYYAVLALGFNPSSSCTSQGRPGLHVN